MLWVLVAIIGLAFATPQSFAAIHASIVVPDSLLPSSMGCNALWQELAHVCSPCVSAEAWLTSWGLHVPPICPALALHGV